MTWLAGIPSLLLAASIFHARPRPPQFDWPDLVSRFEDRRLADAVISVKVSAQRKLSNINLQSGQSGQLGCSLQMCSLGKRAAFELRADASHVFYL